MDIRRLRYFSAVVEYGGFAQAAAALHVTQPAISMAVRKLEEEVGHSLIERAAKPMALTVFGKEVYRSWQVHANEQRRLMREIRSMGDLNTAQVSLVLGATFPMQPVVGALESLRSRYPGFRLGVAMGSYTGDLGAVLDGSADMILSQLPAKGPDQRFFHQPLVVDRFRVVARRSHPLTRKKRILPKDLLSYPWSGGGPYDAFLPGWSRTFAEHGLDAPEPVLHTTSINATMAALREHDYLAMLPVGCITDELSIGSLRILPVAGLEWRQEKGASWLLARALSPAADTYLKELRRQLSGNTNPTKAG